MQQFELTKLNKREAEQFERSAIVAALFRLCDPLRTMDNIKRGDTVQLKSGGPIMTVGRPYDDSSGRLNCDWFEGSDLKHGVFYQDQLNKVEPASDDGAFA